MVKTTIIPERPQEFPMKGLCNTTSNPTMYFTSARERGVETEGPVKHSFLLSPGLKIFPKSNILKEGSRDHTYKSLSTVLLVVSCAVWNIPPWDKRQSSFSRLGWHWSPNFFSYVPSLSCFFFVSIFISIRYEQDWVIRIRRLNVNAILPLTLTYSYRFANKF
jgi:hypothetical protein